MTDMTSAPDELPDLLTPGEVAALFRVVPKTLARWARDEQIQCIRTPGGHRRYRAADVRKLLAFKKG